jgi:ABC-type uncharacterized transport system substrate-binding protein
VAGLVDSLARPGGNLTGFTTISPVIAGKRLELLKEIDPKLSRVAVLWTPKQSDQSWKESQLAARELGLFDLGIPTPTKREITLITTSAPIFVQKNVR